jgi:hypothetical protein
MTGFPYAQQRVWADHQTGWHHRKEFGTPSLSPYIACSRAAALLVALRMLKTAPSVSAEHDSVTLVREKPVHRTRSLTCNIYGRACAYAVLNWAWVWT